MTKINFPYLIKLEELMCSFFFLCCTLCRCATWRLAENWLITMIEIAKQSVQAFGFKRAKRFTGRFMYLSLICPTAVRNRSRVLSVHLQPRD